MPLAFPTRVSYAAGFFFSFDLIYIIIYMFLQLL